MGQLTADEAVAQAIDGAHCRVERAADGAIVIRPAIAVKPAPRPTTPAPVQAVRPSGPPVVAIEPDQVVSEIVVTSPRRAELSGRAPMSITAVTGQTMQQRGQADVEALTFDVAGMTVTNLGPGRDKVLLRGLSDGVFTGQTQSTVGLYLDNVPLTYNAPDPDLRVVDIDRVEVMRGPQGTLYGIGSIGGIVRMVSKRPDLDVWSGSGEAQTSETRFGGANGEVEGVINAPLIRGRLALRASAYVERRSGYIDDVNLGLKNVNHVGRDGARVELRGALNANWNVSAGIVHQSINSRDTQYDELGLPPLDRANSIREPHDNDFDMSFLRVDGNFSGLRLTASSARLLHNLDDVYDASPLFGPASGAAAYDATRRIEIFVNEVTLASASSGRLQWLAGAFYSNGENGFDSVLRRPPTAATRFYVESRNDLLDERAVFGEATLQLTPAVSVAAGARWFIFRFDTTSQVSQSAGVREFNGRATASGFSPKLTVQYQWDDHATFYAQVSEGYRAGGFNTSGLIGQAFDGSANNPGRRYDPDELWNIETGAKLSLWNERVKLRAAIFYAVWRNIQTDQFLASGLPFTANAGDGVNGGVEFEVTARPLPRWEFRVAALADDPHLTSASPAFASRIDAGLPGVPSGSASIGVTYARPITGDRTLRLEAAAGYVGRSHLTFDAQHLYAMGDYTTANLSAALAGRRVTTTLFIDNLFDSRGDTFAFGDPFRVGHSVEATPVRPRTGGIRLSASF